MPSRKAEAGHAGRLDSLPVAMDLKTLGVYGNGAIEIDDGSYPPRVKWCPKRHFGREFFSEGYGGIDAAVRFPEGFGAQGAASSEPIKEVGVVGFEQESYKARKDFDAYRSRIEYLRNEAVRDGYVLSSDSEIDFQQFVRSASGLQRGSLVLMDNGNVRAIWKDGRGSRIGLQFLGGGMVQYVVFMRRAAERRMSRVVGRDTFEGILRQIGAFDLGSLFYE